MLTGQKVVKEITAPGGRHKVLILLNDDGQYSVESRSLYEYEGIKDWEDTTIGLHLFDDFASAIEAVSELLRNESGKVIIPEESGREER